MGCGASAPIQSQATAVQHVADTAEPTTANQGNVATSEPSNAVTNMTAVAMEKSGPVVAPTATNDDHTPEASAEHVSSVDQHLDKLAAPTPLAVETKAAEMGSQSRANRGGPPHYNASRRGLISRAQELSGFKGKEIDSDMLDKIFSGDFEAATTTHVNKKVVRLFTSSTFDDTKAWRDTLMADVYPFLQHLCKLIGLDFTVVDMRWGVRETTGDDHGTSDLCMWELQKCKDLSLGPAFVSFLGDRYGYRPFPPRIPKDDLETMLTFIETKSSSSKASGDEAEIIALINQWFLLDENRVPPEYLLQPVSTFFPDYVNTKDQQKQSAASAQWWPIFEKLQLCLREASSALSDQNPLRVLFTISVTNEEVMRGVLQNDQRDRQCFVYNRNLTGLDLPNQNWIVQEDRELKRFFDWSPDGDFDSEPHNKLTQLKKVGIPSCGLDPGRVFDWSLPWAQQKAGLEDAHFREHVESFAEHFAQTIGESILDAFHESRIGTDSLVEEVLAHLVAVSNKAKAWVGRDNLILCVLDYAKASDIQTIMVVHGHSGCGKTTLMSRCAIDIRKAYPTAIVAVRLLGTTPGSSTSRAVMTSVLAQLACAYGPDAEIPDAAKLSEMAATEFQKECIAALEKCASREKPLFLVLDSIDQLTDDEQGRRMEWLPLEWTNPALKIIVSMLPDIGPSWAEINRKFSVDVGEAAGSSRADASNDMALRRVAQDGKAVAEKLVELLPMVNPTTAKAHLQSFLNDEWSSDDVLTFCPWMQTSIYELQQLKEKLAQSDDEFLLGCAAMQKYDFARTIRETTSQFLRGSLQLLPAKYECLPWSIIFQKLLENIDGGTFEDRGVSAPNYSRNLMLRALLRSLLLDPSVSDVWRKHPELQPSVTAFVDIVNRDHSEGRFKHSGLCDSTIPLLTAIVDRCSEQSSQRQMPVSHWLAVTPLVKSDVGDILSTWQKSNSRQFQTDQLVHLTQQCESAMSPLYLRLAFDRAASLWHSYSEMSTITSPLSTIGLGASIQSLINDLFVRLERRHGTVLVSHALGYITCSGPTGITAAELEDILSCDDAVLDDVYQWWVPPLRRLPPLIWSRVRMELGAYVVERGCDDSIVYAWYHRQFWTVAEDRYLNNGVDAAFLEGKLYKHGTLWPERHRHLAHYFGGNFDTGVSYQGRDDDQPRLYNRHLRGMDLFESEDCSRGLVGVVVNKRRTATQLYHQVRGGLFEEIGKSTLGNFDYLHARTRYGQQFDALRADVVDALAVVRQQRSASVADDGQNASRTVVFDRIEELALFIRRHLHSLEENRHEDISKTHSWVQLALLQAPADSIVGLMATEFLHAIRHGTDNAGSRGRHLLETDGLVEPLPWCRVKEEDPRIMSIEQPTQCAVLTRSGSAIVNATGGEGTVQVWDGVRGNLLETWKGHTGSVDRVMLLANDTLVVSQSSDCTIRVWDFATGALLHTLVGHYDYQSDGFHNKLVVEPRLTASSSGSMICSQVALGVFAVWDVGTGEVIQTVSAPNNGWVWFGIDDVCLLVAEDAHLLKEKIIFQPRVAGDSDAKSVVTCIELTCRSGGKTSPRGFAAKLWGPTLDASERGSKEHGLHDIDLDPSRGRVAGVGRSSAGVTGDGSLLMFLWEFSDGKLLANATSTEAERLSMMQTMGQGKTGCIKYCNDYSYVAAAVGGSYTIGLWSGENLDYLLSLRGPSLTVRSISFSQSVMCTSGSSQQIICWNVEHAMAARNRTGGGDENTPFVFRHGDNARVCNNGSMIIVKNDALSLVDAVNGNVLHTQQLPEQFDFSADRPKEEVASPDGKWVYILYAVLSVYDAKAEDKDKFYIKKLSLGGDAAETRDCVLQKKGCNFEGLRMHPSGNVLIIFENEKEPKFRSEKTAVIWIIGVDTMSVLQTVPVKARTKTLDFVTEGIARITMDEKGKGALFDTSTWTMISDSDESVACTDVVPGRKDVGYMRKGTIDVSSGPTSGMLIQGFTEDQGQRRSSIMYFVDHKMAIHNSVMFDGSIIDLIDTPAPRISMLESIESFCPISKIGTLRGETEFYAFRCCSGSIALEWMQQCLTTNDATTLQSLLHTSDHFLVPHIALRLVAWVCDSQSEETMALLDTYLLPWMLESEALWSTIGASVMLTMTRSSAGRDVLLRAARDRDDAHVMFHGLATNTVAFLLLLCHTAVHGLVGVVDRLLVRAHETRSLFRLFDTDDTSSTGHRPNNYNDDGYELLATFVRALTLAPPDIKPKLGDVSLWKLLGLDPSFDDSFLLHWLVAQDLPDLLAMVVSEAWLHEFPKITFSEDLLEKACRSDETMKILLSNAVMSHPSCDYKQLNDAIIGAMRSRNEKVIDLFLVDNLLEKYSRFSWIINTAVQKANIKVLRYFLLGPGSSRIDVKLDAVVREASTVIESLRFVLSEEMIAKYGMAVLLPAERCGDLMACAISSYRGEGDRSTDDPLACVAMVDDAVSTVLQQRPILNEMAKGLKDIRSDIFMFLFENEERDMARRYHLDPSTNDNVILRSNCKTPDDGALRVVKFLLSPTMIARYGIDPSAVDNDALMAVVSPPSWSNRHEEDTAQVASNRVAVVRELLLNDNLALGVDPSARNNDVLREAAKAERNDIVVLLLEPRMIHQHLVDPCVIDATAPVLETLATSGFDMSFFKAREFLQACAGEDVEKCKSFFEEDGMVRCMESSMQKTIINLGLLRACKAGRKEIAELLLSPGDGLEPADPLIHHCAPFRVACDRNEGSDHPLDVAAMFVTEEMLERGVDVFAQRASALLLACRKADVQVVRLICDAAIKGGSKLSAKNFERALFALCGLKASASVINDGYRPGRQSTDDKRFEILQCLMAFCEERCLVNYKTLVTLAAQNECKDDLPRTVAGLLDSSFLEAEGNMLSSEILTTLCERQGKQTMAAWEPALKILLSPIALSRGIVPNVGGNTPLLEAASHANMFAMRLLLTEDLIRHHGVDPAVNDNSILIDLCHTDRYSKLETPKLECLQILLAVKDSGIDVHCKNDAPLRTACESGWVGHVQLLLSMDDEFDRAVIPEEIRKQL